jgi:hypothetical protein
LKFEQKKERPNGAYEKNLGQGSRFALKFERKKTHVTVYKKCYMGICACAESDLIMYIVPDSQCIANVFFEICPSLSGFVRIRLFTVPLYTLWVTLWCRLKSFLIYFPTGLRAKGTGDWTASYYPRSSYVTVQTLAKFTPER